MVDLFLHHLICLYGVVLNYLSTGTTLPLKLSQYIFTFIEVLQSRKSTGKLDLLFKPEDGGSTCLQNVGEHLLYCTASHPRIVTTVSASEPAFFIIVFQCCLLLLLMYGGYLKPC
jgi:hypothetical protein